MKKEQINELFEKFESACLEVEGVECWSARDLQKIFGYTKWDNFKKVLEKAQEGCVQAGGRLSDHFAAVGKVVDLGSGSQRTLQDFALTRYACYLIAQNGEPTKPEIAFAQTYFAVQTRKQEVIEQRLLDVARVSAREKLSKSEKKLSGVIYERGVDDAGFAIIRSLGDEALFGGYNTQSMKNKLSVPENRPLADYLPTLLLKAKDFAAELTSHNVVDKDLCGNAQISDEHIENNKEVRAILLKRGVQPEALPPAEDIKKVKRRLKKEETQVLEANKKVPDNLSLF
ncbi:MAG: DNA damage-inducible protein D [Bacteroidetes bacterium]|nr:MAG: DNA damage-inducible protein D [Bacteroidota bacterium]